MTPYLYAAHRSIGGAENSLTEALDHLEEWQPRTAQERARKEDMRQRLQVLAAETALALHYAGLLLPPLGKVAVTQ